MLFFDLTVLLKTKTSVFKNSSGEIMDLLLSIMMTLGPPLTSTATFVLGGGKKGRYVVLTKM